MPNLFEVQPPMNPSPSQDNVIANTELLKRTVGWTCKNEFNPTNKKVGYAITEVFGQTPPQAYIATSTNGLTYIAQIDINTDYTISRKTGVGNKFEIALFTTQPTIPNTSAETGSAMVVDGNIYDEYTFNSDDYEWVAFTVNDTTGDPSTIDSTAQVMLKKAEILDSSYEAYHDSVDTVITALSNSLLNRFYPVGTIYETTNGDFNPNTTWGGSWSKIEGKFLLGSSTSYVIGNTGGEETHTLTESEMPRHRHSTGHLEETTGLGESYIGDGNTPIWTNTVTDYTGGNGAHNNMPPYQVVNIWKRNS